MNVTDALLRGILATVARVTFPQETLLKIVAPTAGSSKQLLAYNLCDGETSQADIGKRAKLDQGQLSRTIARWVEAGVIVRVGPDQLPLHVYPLANMPPKAVSKKR